jgi:GNAT superfamily N-acetyltransferase
MAYAMNITIQTLTGQAVAPLVPDIARLRRAVFREFPYLYEGNSENEQEHLRKFIANPRTAVVVAFDNQVPVGISTCLPLADEGESVRAPFIAAGLTIDDFFYFSESVLLPAYRGTGIGVAFMAAREEFALSQSNAAYACFCAVNRDPTDPRRPADWVPLDNFWQKRGFTRYPNLVCTMRWPEIGHPEKVTNRLTFWLKSLRGAPLP